MSKRLFSLIVTGIMAVSLLAGCGAGSEENQTGDSTQSAQAAGADLFKLEPMEPYTDTDLDWTDDNSRVSREHDSPDQREVELLSTTVDDWDSVSTVYIGYPIWWAVAAWPIDSFIEANEFAGKTVIPFCTSSSSGLGL